MAVTTRDDLFIPQVVGDRAADILFARTPLLTTGVVTDASSLVQGSPGENVTFPYFSTDISGIVQNSVRNSRTGVTPNKLSMSSYEEEMESKTVSFDADSFAIMDASEDTLDHLSEVVANEAARAMQSSAIRKAMQTDLELDIRAETTKTLTVDAILRAKMKWGEYAGEFSPVLFLHSKQFADLAQTSDYKSLGSSARGDLVTAASKVGDIYQGNVFGVFLALVDSLPNQDARTVSSITLSGSTATVTTSTDHGFEIGEFVTISGADQAGYNGTFEVTAVPTSTSLKYMVSGSPATPATGSATIETAYTGLMCAPDAIGLYVKKAPEMSVIPHAGTSVRTYDTHFRFATTLKRRRPRPVVRLITQ